MLLDLLTVAVLAYFGSRLVVAARGAVQAGARHHARAIVKGLRPRHFLMAVPVLVLVVTAAVLLLQVPGLSFGWWTAIGGQGNPVIGTTDRTADSALAWLVPLVFLALLVPALPLLVEREERAFRAGSEHRSFWPRVRRGMAFGLVHAVVGIPLAAALALSVGGWYFTWAYLRAFRLGGPAAALQESTRAHLGYNLVILAIVGLSLAFGL